MKSILAALAGILIGAAISHGAESTISFTPPTHYVVNVDTWLYDPIDGTSNLVTLAQADEPIQEPLFFVLRWGPRNGQQDQTITTPAYQVGTTNVEVRISHDPNTWYRCWVRAVGADFGGVGEETKVDWRVNGNPRSVKGLTVK